MIDKLILILVIFFLFMNISKSSVDLELTSNLNDNVSNVIIEDSFDLSQQLFFENNFFCYKKSDSLIFCNNEKILFCFAGKDIVNISSGLIEIKSDDNNKLIDNKGKILIENYEDIYCFSYDYQLLELADYSGGGFNYFNSKFANIIIPNNQLLSVGKNGYYALYNYKGLPLTDYKYDEIVIYSEDLFIVRKDSKYGIIDSDGIIVLETKYDDICNITGFNFNQALFHQFINNHEYSSYKQFMKTRINICNNEKFFKVKRGTKWGFVDKNDSTIIDIKYDFLSNVNFNKIIFKDKGKFGILNTNNQVILQNFYNELYILRNDIFIGKFDEKWLVFNADTVFYKFNENLKFENFYDLVLIKNNNCYFLLTDKNKLLTLDSKEVEISDRNFITMKYNEYWVLADKNGNVLNNIKSDNKILFLNDGDFRYSIISNKNKYRLIDKMGCIRTPAFDDIGMFTEGVAQLKNNNKYGLINHDFEIILQPDYDTIEIFKGYIKAKITDTIFYFKIVEV